MTQSWLEAERAALLAEVERLNKENDRLLDDAEIIDDIVALQKVEIEALKRLIADNARDESGRVSMPLAGLRKIEEARERAEAAERQVEALKKYTRHKPLCDAIWSTEDTPCPCSCGLAEALAAAEVKP